MKKLTFRLTLQEEALGTLPNNPDLYSDYIASKAPDAATVEDEIAAIGVDGVTSNGKTVFARTPDGLPAIYNYHVKGMFKDACGMLKKVPHTESSKIKAHKKGIDGLLMVQPRMIPFDIPGEMGECQRPLRASTPQGERVALAYSETVPAGSTLTFSVICMDEGLIPAVKEWIGYGALRGLGQWRNSGKGIYTAELLSTEETSFAELSGLRGA